MNLVSTAVAAAAAVGAAGAGSPYVEIVGAGRPLRGAARRLRLRRGPFYGRSPQRRRWPHRRQLAMRDGLELLVEPCCERVRHEGRTTRSSSGSARGRRHGIALQLPSQRSAPAG